MLRKLAYSFALAGAVLSLAVAQEGDTPDDSQPKIFAVAFQATGNAQSKELETALAKIRTDYAAKDVLFLTADVTTVGSRHQSKLLLNSLGIAREVWADNSKNPGRLVLVSAETGNVIRMLQAKDGATAVTAALDEALTPPPEEEGCEEGCGCGCGCD